jgi:protein-tyrosine phosphatase
MAAPSNSHSILVVCTANVCRSVMAEHLLKRSLAMRGLDGRFDVKSAGTRVVTPLWESGFLAQGPSKGALATLYRRGIEVNEHTRTRVVPEVLDASSLVLTMERYHLEEIANLWPPSEPKLFVLKEAALLAKSKPFEADDFLSRVRELDARRPSPRYAVSLDRSFDVEDPIGGDPEFYEMCASEIEEAIDSLVDTLWNGI